MNICLLLVLLLPAMASAQTGLYVPAGGSYDVGDGTLDLANQNIYVAGDLLVGSGQLTAQDILIAEGGKMVVGTGAIRLTRNWTNRGTFEAGSSTVYFDTEPSTVSTRSLAQVSGETLFWNATIAENKTVMVSDCSIKVENEKTQPDSSSVIVPDGSQASIELCTQGGGGLAEDDDGADGGSTIEPVIPVPIPLWVLLLMIVGTPYLVWRKS
jgi:hypothetical protein